MPAPKTLTELLRNLPQDDLDVLASNLREEISKLSEQLRFVEDAQSGRKRTRRSTNGSKAQAGTATRINRRDLVGVVAEIGRPVFPAEVAKTLRGKGLIISSDSVRTSMGRLVDIDHLLVRGEDGRYSLASRASGNGSGHRLFGDSESSSADDAAASSADRG